MTDSPVTGWYSDPADPTRLRYWDGKAWTDQIKATETRSAVEVSRRRLPGIAIVGIVVAALLTIGGFIAIILNTGGDPSPTPTESPSPTAPTTPDPYATRTAPAVLAPEGWEVYVSRSGAFEYAYNPDWTDIWTPEYEQMLIGVGDLEGVEMEVAGSWVLDGSIVTGGTNLIIVATSDGTPIPGLLELQAGSFVRSNVASIGSDDFQEILSEGFTMANGYDAWRIDYTLTTYETPISASVVTFMHETTLGFIYVASLSDFDEWMPDFLAVVDSFVVVKPPVSP
ncbi:MAG: DUF2510 domain-containing protein [Demequinaceae bacterium]|nr:DUF2510 domain-containing protein [Demequinaceae bacterium]